MAVQIINKLITLWMLLWGTAVRQEELNPGDHIYTYRRFRLYSHHGIYIGEGNVIHLTRTGVNKTSLDIFRREGEKLHSLHSYVYGRPLLEYWLTWRGTRTILLDTKSPKEVINKAWELHEGDNFGKYDLLNNNCEHFATFCKTGIRASAQIGLISAFKPKVKEVKNWAIKILQGN
ncbi:hypothetical protein ACJRO7_032728 [Eucalyptus globulus]|uniref:LRAT domain-containing protein n=1 Tax=Eucalyptus globulus TaxID=34317 RepID=A0ABD3JIW2_EUCGL